MDPVNSSAQGLNNFSLETSPATNTGSSSSSLLTTTWNVLKTMWNRATSYSPAPYHSTSREITNISNDLHNQAQSGKIDALRTILPITQEIPREEEPAQEETTSRLEKLPPELFSIITSHIPPMEAFALQILSSSVADRPAIFDLRKAFADSGPQG